MARIKKEDIEKKLEYIGLDLENIPSFLTQYDPLGFHVENTYDEKKYRVYRYIPIEDIKIFISPTDRTEELRERYKLASPIATYLVPDTEEGIEKHTRFLNMLKQVSIAEIEGIEEEQKELQEKIPLEVKFPHHYEWQIFYAEATDTYFMLVPEKEEQYACLFYLLKKQLENKKRKTKIFVPISYVGYSAEFLRKSEIVDLENYLWLFTNDWPQIYEVYDKKGVMSLQIVGDTVIYEKIKSIYNIKFTSREKAVEEYKLIKALFILQTEVANEFSFHAKINNYGGLDFYFQDKKLTYSLLPEFLKEQTENIYKKIVTTSKDIVEFTRKLSKLKEISAMRDLEYLSKEKQITTYLDCRKSFFGKVKYFFKSGRTKKDDVLEKLQKRKKEEQVKVEVEFTQKEAYTLEDLVTICKQLEEKVLEYKNLRLDVEAQEKKIEMMEKKIENAETYLEEIENHKKSIFEFWKFANKDNDLGLNPGEKRGEEQPLHTLKKVFEYEEDMETLAKKMDDKQRRKLSKEELDSIFVTKTETLKALNALRKPAQTKQEQEIVLHCFQTILEEFKKAKKNAEIVDIDIFGGMSEDKRKIKILANKKHREVEKNIYSILGIHEKIEEEQYKEVLKQVLYNLQKAYEKVTTPYPLSLYKAGSPEEDVTNMDYCIFHLTPEKALEKELDKELNLYRLNIEEGMPLLFFTNSTFYDNVNQTLPLGMDVAEDVLVDMSKFELEEVKQDSFRMNCVQKDNTILNKKINVYEYNVH